MCNLLKEKKTKLLLLAVNREKIGLTPSRPQYKKPEKLTTTRARMVNPVVLKRYSLNEILVELDISNSQQLSGTVMKPENNSNTTRSKFLLWKAPDRTTANRTNVTIMDCANAVGNVTPPMFVVKGKTSRSLHGFNNEAAPERHMLAYQEKGWINDTLGEVWFRKIFLKICGDPRHSCSFLTVVCPTRLWQFLS